MTSSHGQPLGLLSLLGMFTTLHHLEISTLACIASQIEAQRSSQQEADEFRVCSESFASFFAWIHLQCQYSGGCEECREMLQEAS